MVARKTLSLPSFYTASSHLIFVFPVCTYAHLSSLPTHFLTSSPEQADAY